MEAAGEKYVTWSGGRKPQYFNFFEAQPTLGMTRLEDIWNSSQKPPAAGADASLEVWFNSDFEAELRELLETLGLKARKAMDFGEMRALRLEAGRSQFDMIALRALASQLRPASGLSNAIYHVPAGVQAAIVDETAARISPAPEDAPRTCLLDTGLTPLDEVDGSPSSLSCTIDRLSSDVARRRLFCVAAGNLDPIPSYTDYQALNDVTGMMSPAQAWNALTISACTDRDQTPSTHGAVANAGDLSPWARTAVNWDRRHRTAAKPDVVYEGGNTMFDLASQDVANHSELCILTTSGSRSEPLALTGQTSAATAAVAGICTRVQAAYPEYWPETVRGLIVHSTSYSPAMEARADRVVGADKTRKTRTKALLDRFGYGRVDPAKAFDNARDALTLISQASLQPSRYNEEGRAVLGHMRMHPMPWPIEVLESLNGIEAELRVTLSYFVEPNPGKSVLGKPELYPSHGFNFDVRRPDESEEDAVARINGMLEKPGGDPTAPNWTFGSDRGRGSVRHDRLRLDDAADLARMSGIMVYPQSGWWKTDARHVDTVARYALIVTIRTEDQDIYTRIPQPISI